jgi:hypothetical protein
MIRYASVMVRDTRLDTWVPSGLADRVRSTADLLDTNTTDVVRRSLRLYTKQRPVYSFDGTGASFVRDAWASAYPSESADAENAERRLSEFRTWQKETRADFATVTTGTASEVIPPGYRPLLADWTQDRPLYAAATRGPLSDATPFVVPGEMTDANVSGAVADHTEGSAAGEGTMTFTGSVTVTPATVSGLFAVTRELVDGSSPQADQIAMGALRESYARKVEVKIFTELNSVQSGTITNGQVPNGAQARTSTGAALPADLRKAILTFVNVRGQKARSVVASSRTTVAEALETLDLTHWALRDVSIELSPWITGTAAGDGDVFVLAGDLFAWSSALAELRFAEKRGPHILELALFGYFATRVVAPRGLASIRHS